jgi:hypothetical protein
MAYPASQQRLALEAVRAILDGDPVVGVAGSDPVTFRQLADGFADVARPYAEGADVPPKLYPTASECPYVRILPGECRAGRIHENQHQYQMVLGFEVFAAGCGEGPVYDLWKAIYVALFRPDNLPAAQAIRQRLGAIGCREHVASRFPSNLQAVGASGHASRGLAELTLTLWTDS